MHLPHTIISSTPHISHYLGTIFQFTLNIFFTKIIVHKNQVNRINNQSSFIYSVGLIGALLYFIQHAQSFWGGALGVLKAIFWPGMLVYKLLEFLKM